MVNSGSQFRVVFRIEIATLLDSNGSFDLSRMERLAMICTNLINSGVKVILVSSGAIVLGSYRLGLPSPPSTLTGKQAVAAIGQAELITLYQQCFDEFNQLVAQVLLTQDAIAHLVWSKNAENTFNRLLEMNILPIVNENDSVSTEDIELGDNYPLAYQVAQLAHAHLIILRHKEEGRYLLVGCNGQSFETNESGLFRYMEKFRNDGSFTDIGKHVFPESIPSEYIF